VGVDVSREGLAKARMLNLPHVEWVEANYESWRPDTQFDAIIFNECIGYAADPAATLAAFARHLAPDGRFILSHYRFGSFAAQWRRMASVCDTLHATADRFCGGDATGAGYRDAGFFHTALVTGLAPGARYAYSVGDDADESATFEFRVV
jgi:SAM-dependent methyltransferase